MIKKNIPSSKTPLPLPHYLMRRGARGCGIKENKKRLWVRDRDFSEKPLSDKTSGVQLSEPSPLTPRALP